MQHYAEIWILRSHPSRVSLARWRGDERAREKSWLLSLSTLLLQGMSHVECTPIVQ